MFRLDLKKNPLFRGVHSSLFFSGSQTPKPQALLHTKDTQRMASASTCIIVYLIILSTRNLSLKSKMPRSNLRFPCPRLRLSSCWTLEESPPKRLEPQPRRAGKPRDSLPTDIRMKQRGYFFTPETVGQVPLLEENKGLVIDMCEAPAPPPVARCAIGDRTIYHDLSTIYQFAIKNVGMGRPPAWIHVESVPRDLNLG